MEEDTHPYLGAVPSSNAKPWPQGLCCRDLYHRSLVSVIKEKLRRPHDNIIFTTMGSRHFGKRTGRSRDIRVHGELYTSLHIRSSGEVLESPGEPGCEIAQGCCRMMFWSDITHLRRSKRKTVAAYLFFATTLSISGAALLPLVRTCCLFQT